MKLSKASRTLGLAAVAAIVSPLALADDAGWYVGGNIGRSKANIDDERISSRLLGSGFGTATISDDDRDSGHKIFGGYKFNRNFALEGGYFDLGKFGYAATTTIPAPGTLRGDMRLNGLNLDAVGTIPITERFAAFGRVGLNYAQARDSFAATGPYSVVNPNPTKRELNYKVGLGLQYDFTPSLAMRLEAERYRINDAVGSKGDVDLVSVGLIYRFGEKAPAPTPRTAAPERIAAAPPTPPPPVVTPAPTPRAVVVAPMVLKKVSFSADSLFAFDKAVMKPDGNRQLDKLAADLRGTSFDTITVTGHTDRLGPHDYNMKLSARRAEAVKAYLVESAGILPGKIETKGVDGADPVTKPGECKGEKASKLLIACLQPDRRVEVEVSAMQASR